MTSAPTYTTSPECHECGTIAHDVLLSAEVLGIDPAEAICCETAL